MLGRRIMDWLRHPYCRDAMPSPGTAHAPDVAPTIPEDVRRQIAAQDAELQRELVRAQTQAYRALEDVKRGLNV
jgi:hypothetical protein